MVATMVSSSVVRKDDEKDSERVDGMALSRAGKSGLAWVVWKAVKTDFVVVVMLGYAWALS